jgi:hypothetical protein
MLKGSIADAVYVSFLEDLIDRMAKAGHGDVVEFLLDEKAKIEGDEKTGGG